MVVDPQWLRDHAARANAREPRIIDEDRHCTNCGYSLKGLRTDGRCSECGTIITPDVTFSWETRDRQAAESGADAHGKGAWGRTDKNTKRRRLSEVYYEHLPAPTLRRFARATTLMWIGILMVMSGLFLAWWSLVFARVAHGATDADSAGSDRFIGGVFIALGVPGGLLWWFGAITLVFPTTVIRVGAGDRDFVDLAPRAFTGAAVALCAAAQALLPLSMLCAGISALKGGLFVAERSDTVMAFVVGAGVCGFVAASAAGPLCLICRNLADLAHDDQAFNRAWLMPVGLPLIGGLMAASPSMHMQLATGYGLFGLITGLAVFLFFLYVPWSLVMLFHTLSAVCRWAPHNQRHHLEREQRFIDRAEAVARKAAAERAERGD